MKVVKKMSKITFYESLKPLLIISSFLGVISFNLGELTRSNLRIITNVLLVIFYIILSAHSLYERSILDTKLLLTTTDMMQASTSTLQVVVSWIMSALIQDKMISFLKRVSEIDKAFRQLGVYIYYDAVHRTVIKRLIVRLTLGIASTISQLFIYDYALVVSQIGFNFILYFAILVNVVIVEQFYTYTKLVRVRYEILNQHIQQVQKCVDVTKENISYIKLTEPIGSKLSTLRIICPIHHELTKIAKLLNDSFGIMLLMSFQASFVAIIVSLYDCSVYLRFFKMENVKELCGSIIMCCTYVLDCLCICYSCHSTVEAVSIIERREVNIWPKFCTPYILF